MEYWDYWNWFNSTDNKDYQHMACPCCGKLWGNQWQPPWIVTMPINTRWGGATIVFQEGDFKTFIGDKKEDTK